VWRAAQELGHETVEAIVVPFKDSLDNQTELDRIHQIGGLIIPYGSVKLVKIAHRSGWHGCFFDPDTFRVDVWNQYRDDMLNQDSMIATVAELRDIFRGVDHSDQWFIRPVEDLKAFNGSVADVGDIIDWMSSPRSGSFAFGEDTLVAVAPVKTIYSEARYFVVSGRIVSGSYYRMGGRLIPRRINQPETLAMAQEVIDRGWLPHANCVVDIADTEDGLRVIEFNTINSSGFYDHDIGAIVTALSDATDDWPA